MSAGAGLNKKKQLLISLIQESSFMNVLKEIFQKICTKGFVNI